MKVKLKPEFVNDITLESGAYRYFTFSPGKVYDIDQETYNRNRNYYFDNVFEDAFVPDIRIIQPEIVQPVQPIQLIQEPEKIEEIQEDNIIEEPIFDTSKELEIETEEIKPIKPVEKEKLEKPKETESINNQNKKINKKIK